MEAKDEIKARIRISELISEYLELKPAGSGSFKAICPFHTERSPSFHVSEPKEIWHCFGCDKGGDIFTFVMEMEGVDFKEALQMLAKKAGVELPVFQPNRNPKKEEEQQTLLHLHELAQKVYAKLLLERDEAKFAREYLENRGITKELIEKFGLGFAPNSWDTLARFFESRKLDLQLGSIAGLISKRKEGTGFFDRFRNRLMIPLSDKQGNVIGFTARILEGDDGPKYLNSPETPIYHKGRMLYGLHLAKSAIRKEKRVIIVEGNLDVIASHKAGVEAVVASSGTALTEEQIHLLRKYTNTLHLCFDGDAAGIEAAKRGIALAQSLGCDISIIAIPENDGKDPDDVVQKNPARWVELANHPIPVMQYYFDIMLARHHPGMPEGKKAISQFLIPEIARLSDAVEREHWLQKLSDILRVDTSLLRQASPIHQNQKKTQEPGVNTRPQANPVMKISKEEQAAAFLVGVFLAYPQTAKSYFPRIAPELLPIGIWSDIYKNLVLLYTQAVTSDSAPNQQSTRQDEALIALMPDYESLIRRSMLRGMDLLSSMTPEIAREEIERHIQLLANASKEVQKRELQAAIREAERSGENELLQDLIARYTKLI